MHSRSYEPLEDVVTIDGAGQHDLADVTVTARLIGDTEEMETPVGIVIDGGSWLALTMNQLDALIDRLQTAKLDVLRGSDIEDEERDDG